MEYQLNRPNIDTIIDYCYDLLADEKLTVYEFGMENDLVLHIFKDSYYNPEISEEESNMVQISVAKDGRWVDDTGDIYVTDGSLYRELKRIEEYRDFSTL